MAYRKGNGSENLQCNFIEVTLSKGGVLFSLLMDITKALVIILKNLDYRLISVVTAFIVILIGFLRSALLFEWYFGSGDAG